MTNPPKGDTPTEETDPQPTEQAPEPPTPKGYTFLLCGCDGKKYRAPKNGPRDRHGRLK